MDLCGPSRINAQEGEKYLVLVIDDYSRLTWVEFLRNKLEASDKFKIFKELEENQTRCKKRGEYTLYEFVYFPDELGIKMKCTIEGTPQQNRVPKRQNKFVQQMAKAMMQERNIH